MSVFFFSHFVSSYADGIESCMNELSWVVPDEKVRRAIAAITADLLMLRQVERGSESRIEARPDSSVLSLRLHACMLLRSTMPSPRAYIWTPSEP